MTTEVIGSELDEDCVTVFLRGRSVLDREHGELPKRLHGRSYVGGSKRSRAHPGPVEHRRQNRLGRADQHLVMMSLHDDLICR
jgi:hypothetical protein